MSEFKQAFWTVLLAALFGWCARQSWGIWTALGTLALVLSLAWWLQKRRILRLRVKTDQAIERWRVQPRKFLAFLSNLAALGLLLVSIAFFCLSVYRSYRVRKVTDHLSWQASEFYQAICAGMNTAPLTVDGTQCADQWMPTTSAYKPSDQATVIFIAMHELAQKGLIEDRLLYRFQKGTEPGRIEPNIIPTEIGRQVCSYIMSGHQRPPTLPRPTLQEP